MKKRIILTILALALIISLISVSAFAGAPVRIVVDGEEVTFEGQPPVLVDGRVMMPFGDAAMIPLRAAFEGVGYRVAWDNATQTVELLSPAFRATLPREQSTNQHLVISVAPLWTLDPVHSGSTQIAQVSSLIHQTLFTYNEDLELVGLLAEDFEFIDAQTLRVQIRENVLFHDGTILTADDVAFSLERAADSPSSVFISGVIKHVEVVDDLTVIIHLEYPFVPIIATLAHPVNSIISKNQYETEGEDAIHYWPVGLGPFMRDEHRILIDIHEELSLIRFDDYFGELPILESIFFRNNWDSEIRSAMLEVGKAHLALNLTLEDFLRLSDNPQLNMMNATSWTTNYIGFNHQNEYLSNRLVRQAILSAIDMNEINEVVFSGIFETAHGILPESIWGSIAADLPGYGFDLERARMLLAEAGYPDGFSISIWVNDPNMTRLAVAEFVQFHLSAININVEIEMLEWGAYLDLTAHGEHDMFILGWNAATGDPDYALFPLYHSSNWGSLGNRSFYENPEVDRLLEQAREELNLQRRLDILAEIQAILFLDASKIYINHVEILVGANESVRGLRLMPNGLHTIASVYLVD